MILYWPKTTLKKQAFISSTDYSPSWRKSGRNAGRKEPGGNNWAEAREKCWSLAAPHGLLSMISCTTLKHQCRCGPAHSELSLPTQSINRETAPQVYPQPNLIEAFSQLIFPFPADSTCIKLKTIIKRKGNISSLGITCTWPYDFLCESWRFKLRSMCFLSRHHTDSHFSIPDYLYCFVDTLKLPRDTDRSIPTAVHGNHTEGAGWFPCHQLKNYRPLTHEPAISASTQATPKTLLCRWACIPTGPKPTHFFVCYCFTQTEWERSIPVAFHEGFTTKFMCPQPT